MKREYDEKRREKDLEQVRAYLQESVRYDSYGEDKDLDKYRDLVEEGLYMKKVKRVR